MKSNKDKLYKILLIFTLILSFHTDFTSHRTHLHNVAIGWKVQLYSLIAAVDSSFINLLAYDVIDSNAEPCCTGNMQHAIIKTDSYLIEVGSIDFDDRVSCCLEIAAHQHS